MRWSSLPAADCCCDRAVEQAGIPWAVSPENENLCVTADKNYLPYAPENYFPVLWDPHFDYHRLEHLYKVYYVCTPDEENHIDAGGLPLVRYNPHVIFVEPKEKQRGIRYFQQLLSIPDEDNVVFGDGMNDICMFGQGWLSIAMAMPAPRSRRKRITSQPTWIMTDFGTPAGISAGFEEGLLCF